MHSTYRFTYEEMWKRNYTWVSSWFSRNYLEKDTCEILPLVGLSIDYTYRLKLKYVTSWSGLEYYFYRDDIWTGLPRHLMLLQWSGGGCICKDMLMLNSRREGYVNEKDGLHGLWSIEFIVGEPRNNLSVSIMIWFRQSWNLSYGLGRPPLGPRPPARPRTHVFMIVFVKKVVWSASEYIIYSHILGVSVFVSKMNG